MTLRTFAAAGVCAAALTAGGSAGAYTTLLEAQAFVGPCGGSVGCVTVTDQTLTSPGAGASAHAAGSGVLPGAASNATATATWGLLRAYADAYNDAGGYAETQGYTQVEDVIPGANVGGGVYTVQFHITGSNTPTDGEFGANDGGYLYFDAADDVTNLGLGSLNWFSTDAAPGGLVTYSFTVPAGHEFRFRVDFSASAYSSYDNYGTVNGPLLVVSDYGHTIRYDIAGGDGSLIGASGHDYSILPGEGGVPEPAGWALMLMGTGGLGVALRRRRAAA